MFCACSRSGSPHNVVHFLVKYSCKTTPIWLGESTALWGEPERVCCSTADLVCLYISLVWCVLAQQARHTQCMDAHWSSTFTMYSAGHVLCCLVNSALVVDFLNRSWHSCPSSPVTAAVDDPLSAEQLHPHDHYQNVTKHKTSGHSIWNKIYRHAQLQYRR